MQGIYQIICQVSGKSYIGSATNLNRRWTTHCWRLRNGTHHSIALQRAWNKYGESSFHFTVLEKIEDRTMLREREQHWLDTLETAKGKGYNCHPIAESPIGHKHSAEVKAQMSLDRRANPTKYANRSLEGQANIRRAHLGKKRSPETCQRISEAKKGKPCSDLVRLKLKGQVRSLQTRQLMSESAKLRWTKRATAINP